MAAQRGSVKITSIRPGNQAPDGWEGAADRPYTRPMGAALGPTPAMMRAVDRRTVASRHTPAVAHLPRPAPTAAAPWYQGAVFAVLPALPPPAIVDIPRAVATLDLFCSAGATAILLPVPTGSIGASCASGSAGAGCASLVQHERVLAEARARDLRILIDTRSPSRRHPHGLRSVVGAGRFWLHADVDGVVVPDGIADVLFACETAGVDAVNVARWFTTIAGVPVPIGDDRLAAVATFRRDVPFAILEGIERGSGSSLLALLVQLAVCRARETDRSSADSAASLTRRVPPPWCPAATGRSALDRRRQRLFDRLLFSLPGPLLLTCDWSTEQREGEPAAGQGSQNDIAALIGRRLTSAPLQFGQPLPVSLGGGPALAWVSEFGHEVALVAANLGAAPVEVQSDLNGYQGRRVVDMMRATELPRVTDAQYRLTLDPFECRWLHLLAP